MAEAVFIDSDVAVVDIHFGLYSSPSGVIFPRYTPYDLRFPLSRDTVGCRAVQQEVLSVLTYHRFFPSAALHPFWIRRHGCLLASLYGMILYHTCRRQQPFFQVRKGWGTTCGARLEVSCSYTIAVAYINLC